MSNEQWLPDIGPTKSASVVAMDRRPLSERSRLVDRGLVDFRRVCEQMGILNGEMDTVRQTRGLIA